MILICMIATIVISVITFLGITLSTLFFPRIKLGKVTLDTYWIVAIIGALILVIAQLCPINEIKNSWTSSAAVNPLKILVLFFSMTILSIFLDEVGLFKYLASLAVSKAKNSQLTLFFALYFLVSFLTVFTSNDIVILTFTPFICFFCKRTKINPLPYLIAEFTAANTWSMMFIIGNPTNIYLATSADINFVDYFKVMAIPTLCAGFIELIIIRLLFIKQLKVPLTCEDCDVVKIENKADLNIGLVHLAVCLTFLIISPYIGLDMWLISLICASSLLVFIIITRLVKKKEWHFLTNSLKRLPYQLIPFVLSMSIIVISLNVQGIADKIGELLSHVSPILGYGASSFLMANMVNNIPMSILYADIPVALEGVKYYQAIYATIIGSNIGAFLTPVGALAGIMFENLLTKYDVKYTFKQFVKYGVIISVPVIATALVMLLVML